LDRYEIDPWRVALHGYRGGGTLAWMLAFEAPDMVRGVAAVQAALPKAPPDNNPEHRFSTAFIVTSKEADAGNKGAKALRDRKYPVVSKQVESMRYLDDDEFAEMLRWLDSLDKI